MKWYGFVILFVAVTFFNDLVYKVRLDFASKTSLVKIEANLPEEKLPLFGKEDASFSDALPKKPIIVFYFASWCRACLASFPVVTELSKRQDVPFYGIALRDKEEKLEKMLERFGNPFVEIGFDSDTVWAKKMKARTLPTAYVLDKNKKVVAKINGLISKEFYLDTLLPFIQGLEK